MGKAYCRPMNAGLASEPPAVARRIGKLVDALDIYLTPHVVEGAVIEDVRAFRSKLVQALEAEGWSLSYDGGERMKVRTPGHPRPFRHDV